MKIMYFKVTVSYKSPEDIEVVNLEEAAEVKTDKKDVYYKPHKHSYLVNADSVTYAEAKMLRELPDNYIDKDVKGVTESNVNKVIHSSGDEWYLAGVKYELEMTKKGKMKYSHEYIMINGNDIEHALANLQENHHDTVTGYRIVSITESKIIVDKDLLTTDTVVS